MCSYWETTDPQSLLQALKEGFAHGYVEGKDILLEVRSAEGRDSALSGLASELVRLKVSVIVAFQTSAAEAAKDATTQIPIIMVSAGDPVGSRLVASLARPAGNVTGLSSAAAEVTGKNLEILREVLPSAGRIAVLADAVSPFTKSYLAEITVDVGAWEHRNDEQRARTESSSGLKLDPGVFLQ